MTFYQTESARLMRQASDDARLNGVPLLSDIHAAAEEGCSGFLLRML
jgi:hypothetical protein|nr:MAG TPA_asm: hypothetical protein [Caudoviricetes sp.]